MKQGTSKNIQDLIVIPSDSHLYPPFPTFPSLLLFISFRTLYLTLSLLPRVPTQVLHAACIYRVSQVYFKGKNVHVIFHSMSEKCAHSL